MPTTVRQSNAPAARYSRQISQPPPRMIHRTLRRELTPSVRAGAACYFLAQHPGEDAALETAGSDVRGGSEVLEQALRFLPHRAIGIEAARLLQRRSRTSLVALELQGDAQVEVGARVVALLGGGDAELG